MGGRDAYIRQAYNQMFAFFGYKYMSLLLGRRGENFKQQFTVLCQKGNIRNFQKSYRFDDYMNIW